MNIQNRQKLLVVVAIAGMALLLGDRLIVTPLTRAWKERSERIVQLRKNIAQGALLVQRDAVIRERWEHMRTNTLPENVSVAETQVLRAFDRWSQDARISVSSLKPQWKHAADEYMTLEYRADVSGDMRAVTRFLYDVEHDPMALRIESLDITSKDNNGEQLALTLQVSGLLLNPQEP
jgi:hypothetical protein